LNLFYNRLATGKMLSNLPVNVLLIEIKKIIN